MIRSIMKMFFKKKGLLSVTFLGLIYMVNACSKSDEVNQPEVKQTVLDTLSLIGDPAFAGGLILARQNEPPPGVIYPFGSQGGNPIWSIAEWGSKFYL